jgi:hypothetical protein
MARGEIDRFDVLFENLIKRGQILCEMPWRRKLERAGWDQCAGSLPNFRMPRFKVLT